MFALKCWIAISNEPNIVYTVPDQKSIINIVICLSVFRFVLADL